jgi:hypothetical protein
MHPFTPVAFTAVFVGFVWASQSDYQAEVAADQHYCEMVALQKRWMRDHPGAVGREAALARPGWPEHRWDVDCEQFGIFFDQQFSSR